MAFLFEVSGHKLEASQTRVFVWFSTIIFSFYKMLLMNRLEFSCFADFFVRIFKAREDVWFSLKSASRRDCEEHGSKDSSLMLNLCPRIPSLYFLAAFFYPHSRRKVDTAEYWPTQGGKGDIFNRD